MDLTKHYYVTSKRENELKRLKKQFENYQTEYDKLMNDVEQFKQKLKSYFEANPIPHYNDVDEYINEQVNAKYGNELKNAYQNWYTKKRGYENVTKELENRVEPNKDIQKLFELMVKLKKYKIDPVKAVENMLKGLNYSNADELEKSYEEVYKKLFEFLKNTDNADELFNLKKNNKKNK